MELLNIADEAVEIRKIIEQEKIEAQFSEFKRSVEIFKKLFLKYKYSNYSESIIIRYIFFLESFVIYNIPTIDYESNIAFYLEQFSLQSLNSFKKYSESREYFIYKFVYVLVETILSKEDIDLETLIYKALKTLITYNNLKDDTTGSLLISIIGRCFTHITSDLNEIVVLQEDKRFTKVHINKPYLDPVHASKMILNQLRINKNKIFDSNKTVIGISWLLIPKIIKLVYSDLLYNQKYSIKEISGNSILLWKKHKILGMKSISRKDLLEASVAGIYMSERNLKNFLELSKFPDVGVIVIDNYIESKKY